MNKALIFITDSFGNITGVTNDTDDNYLISFTEKEKLIYNFYAIKHQTYSIPLNVLEDLYTEYKPDVTFKKF